MLTRRRPRVAPFIGTRLAAAKTLLVRLLPAAPIDFTSPPLDLHLTEADLLPQRWSHEP
jgi:hypothetical protein